VEGPLYDLNIAESLTTRMSVMRPRPGNTPHTGTVNAPLGAVTRRGAFSVVDLQLRVENPTIYRRGVRTFRLRLSDPHIIHCS